MSVTPPGASAQHARLSATVLAGLTALAVALGGGIVGAAPVAAWPRAAGRDAGTTDLVRLVVRTAPDAAAGVVAAAVTGVAERAGATRVGAIPRLRSVSFDVSAGRSERLRARLARRTDVVSVDLARERFFTADTADPSDARFAEQRTYLAAMGVTAAWDRGAVGGPGVRVAVVDSGVDVTHPDLAGKVAGTFNAVTRGTDVRDIVGHGTGTASVAAAATGDGIGMAGSGRDSSLLAVKVADVTGRIFTDNLAAGVVWAVDNGADVVNLSLGGPSSDRLERAAIAYAQSRDVLVVASAGNAGTGVQQFPAALPGVLSVGATSPAGSVRAPFSSYGPWVDVAAPGGSILVAVPGGGYDVADGTSYSAPLVAGAIGLLEAARPGRSAAQLAQAVIGGTDAARLGFAHGLVHIDRSLDLLPPVSVPALTAPATGSPVSGVVTVSAASSAAEVRFGFGGLTRTVEATNGAASTAFETFGLAGPQRVSAHDCSAAEQCNDAAATATVTVANSAPTLTTPAPGLVVAGDAVAVSAAAPAGAAVRFVLDGDPAGAVTVGAPFAAQLSTERAGSGADTVRAVLCRSDGTVCDTATPATAPVDLTRLQPAITSVTPAAISPDGDGRRDQATVTYRLDRTQTPVLVVRRAGGEVVYRDALGTLRAGPHTAVWTGRRGGAGGAGGSGRKPAVPDGAYTLQVATSAGTLRGLASTTVRVDRTRPSLRKVTVSATRVLPVRDRYLDTVTVTGRTAEELRGLRLEVSTRSGAVVRTVGAGASPAGAVSITWNGRRSGARLSPGTYRLRLVGEDAAGNVGRSPARVVAVSGQRLVRRTGSRIVTAERSIVETWTDDCSQVFLRTGRRHRAWLAYASSSTCTSGDAYAAADHQVRLPRAARYGVVRLSAFGGRGDPRYRDSAKAVYYDDLANLSPHTMRLGPRAGTWTGPRVAAEPLLIRSRVFRWMTITTGVSWYDVASYRVDYTYYVLG